VLEQTPSPHVWGVPQSIEQFCWVSGETHFPSPQVDAQSVEQFWKVSPGPQRPSPQKVQSLGQVNGVSLPEQIPSPQTTDGGQSFGHVEDDSGATQTPSPQPPQSAGQVAGDSVRLQMPSPQSTMQSIRQVWPSPGPQMPSPHTVVLQSAGQLVASSFVPQTPSPQEPQSSEQVLMVS